MSNPLRQVVRGCGTLPHVGEHPGTGVVVFCIFAGALAGAERGGLAGIAVGGGLMAVVIGGIYLSGAYSRAQLSDRISRKQGNSP